MRSFGSPLARRIAWIGVGCLFVAALQAGCAPGESDTGLEDPSTPSASTPATPTGPQTDAQVYATHCAQCHQTDGRGVDGQYPPLRGSHVVTADASWIVRIVLHGLEGPVTIQGERYDAQMPNQWHLPDSTIARVATYVRDRFGDGASRVAPDQVAALRDAFSGRQTPWTLDALRADSLVLDASTRETTR